MSPPKPLTTKPISAESPAKRARAQPAAPAADVEAEERRAARPMPVPTMVKSRLIWKNIGVLALFVLVWVGWRLLFIWLKLGAEWQFKKYDLVFALLPACVAFLLNWRWTREQRTDVITKWSMGWALISLVICLAGAAFGAHPLHELLTQLSAQWA